MGALTDFGKKTPFRAAEFKSNYGPKYVPMPFHALSSQYAEKNSTVQCRWGAPGMGEGGGSGG